VKNIFENKMGRLQYVGFGSLFSVVVALFIFFYARDKGWTIVKWVSGIYLFLTVGIFAIIIAIAILIMLFMLIVYLIMRIRGNPYKKPWQRNEKGKENEANVIDAEYVEYKEEKQDN
jgi:predicted membrane protein